MRVYITGGTGFVGTNLVRVLTKLGHELYLYKIGESVKKSVQSFGPEIIYHLAAELRDEAKMAESNWLLTQELLMWTRTLDFKTFIYTGTSSEYGIKDKPMKEDMECDPTTIYAHTKWAGTLYCQLYAQLWKKNIIILRPFSLYGTDEPEYRFFPTAIKHYLENKTLNLWPGNHDWTHVDDMVTALLYFSGKELPGEIINIGTGIQTSNEEVIKLIEKIRGKKMKLNKHSEPKREGDSDTWLADTDKALSLGWVSTISLQEGLKNQIDEAVMKEIGKEVKEVRNEIKTKSRKH